MDDHSPDREVTRDDFSDQQEINMVKEKVIATKLFISVNHLAILSIQYIIFLGTCTLGPVPRIPTDVLSGKISE